MNIIKYLQAQGIGSRKTCQWLIHNHRVQINHQLIEHHQLNIQPDTVQSLHINNQAALIIPLPYYYILLNKPAGYETSHKPRDYPSIFSLLPNQLRATNIQAVGRLDADTTGVILLTNDGQFNHKLTSPKHHIAKTYQVQLKHPANEHYCQILQQGVILHDDKQPIKAQHASLHNPHTLILTITEGKYHQVKRMCAAAGNRVESLHRLQFDRWDTQDLAPGEWRFIQAS